MSELAFVDTNALIYLGKEQSQTGNAALDSLFTPNNTVVITSTILAEVTRGGYPDGALVAAWIAKGQALGKIQVVPTPQFLPGSSNGERSMVAASEQFGDSPIFFVSNDNYFASVELGANQRYYNPQEFLLKSFLDGGISAAQYFITAGNIFLYSGIPPIATPGTNIVGSNGARIDTSDPAVVIVTDAHGNVHNFTPFDKFRIDPDGSVHHLGIFKPQDYCFSAGTLIEMADGTQRPIESICVDDLVIAYNSFGELIPSRVVRLFYNMTDKWIELRFLSNSDEQVLLVTPGHRFATGTGNFDVIENLIDWNTGSGRLLSKNGSPVSVTARRIFLDEKDVIEKKLTDISNVFSSSENIRKTFNFEVEIYHTYIANGIRVHNDSLFLPQTDEANLADNILHQISNIIFADSPWQNILIGSALRSFGSVAADALLGDDDFNGELLLGRYALNVIDSVGGYAGRSLVSALIGDADIDPALASALSIFAQQTGSNLAQLAALEFLAANAGGTIAFEAQQALDNSANGFNFGEIIASAGFAALGSYAGSQLADLLDMDPELAALVAGPTQAAIVKIGDNIIAGNPWNVGVSTSMLTSLGSVAGTILANNIGNFDTYTEQMGSNIGSNIGAFIFSSLGPVGTFIGSLLGGLLGGLIGGIFGDDPEGFADVEFNTLEDLYRITRVYGEDRTHKDVARDLGESHISIVKSILDLVDGDVLAGNVARLTFGFVEKDFSVKIDGHEYNLGSDAKSTINIGVFEALRSMEIAGGDVYARRAIYATLETYEEWSINTDGATAVPRTVIDPTGGSASTQETSSSDALNQLMSALMIAKEYQNYLRNISAINAIIAADPNSEFAIGWQMTLAQVFALGIHQRSEIDWTGGWDWWLQHNAVTSDKVAFTYLDGERWFVLGADSPMVIADTIAPGQKDTISGGDRSDYIFVDGDRFDGDVSQSGKAGEFIGFNGFDRAGKTEIGFAARMNGGAGDDQIYGGDLGNDLFGGAGNDLLIGGKLDDWLFGGDGDDVLLSGGGLGDVLDGGSGNDRLLGDDSEDWLSGGTGDDVLRGFAGNDILEGGAGRDILIGGDGADRYVYRVDSGVDVISDSGVTGNDVIVFGNGIIPSDLIIHRSAVGDDLMIRINSNQSALLVITGGFLTDFSGIERFEFADGTVWSKGQIISAITQGVLPSVISVGDSASTTSAGTFGDDDLAGAGGEDILQGGVGSDTYRFNLGDGADTIIDLGLSRDIDRVVFGADIVPANLVLTRDSANSSVLVIGVEGTNDKLSIHYRNPDFSDGIELFEFADGTRLSYSELNKLYINQNQTTGSDILAGGFSDEILSGGKGNDTLRGGGGYDQLVGGEGDDTYIYHRGDGYIVISENSGADKLVFGAGISFEDVHLSVGGRDDRSLLITFRGMPGRIEVLGQLSSFPLERFEFADGTIWSAQDIKNALVARATDRNSDYIVGSSQADVLNGSAGNDRIYGYNDKDQIRGGAGDDVLIGGWHDDTYYYDLGDGSDVIIEGYGYGDIDKLIFGTGISLSNLSYSQDPNSAAATWITFANGDRLTLLNMGRYYLGGVEVLQTADGTTLDGQQILDLFRSSWMSAGKDVIRGFDTTDLLNGGAGDDRLYGYDDNDQLIGGTGDDVLIGGWGDDTYYYNLGDGNDVIVDETHQGTADKLIFGNGISLSNLSYSQDPYSSANGWITFANGDRLTLLNMGRYYLGGVEVLQTADGTTLDRQQILDLFRSSWMSAGKDVIRGFDTTDLLNGGAGDDRLYGYDDNDQLIGGTGDDVLIGGWGDDTYYYNLGDGNDVIVDETHQGTADKLIFGNGISLSNLSYSQDPYSSANGWITFANGDRLTLLNMGRYYLGGVEVLQTADGTTLDRQQILDLFRSSWMSAGKDVIRGFDTTDLLNGGAGDDRLYGYDDNDQLIGGTGDDVLIGGWGDDTYYYNLGDGNDVIVEEAFQGSSDRLVFGPGIYASDLTFSFDAYDTDTLRIYLSDGSALVIKDAFGTNGGGIERLEFTDGTFWDRSALAAAVGQQAVTLNTIKGNSGANTLVGTSANDSLDGLEGADTISGGAGDDFADGGLGNDTYLFSRGDGRDVFFGNSGTDTLKLGSNIDKSDILVKLYEINHQYLTLKISGTTDEISVVDVEKIEFADGTVWTEAQLYQVYADQNSTSGDDYIHTYDGDDVINTGAGDDQIYSEDGDDIISGGTGDDYADGNWGNDTYIFNRGDGRDVFDGSFETDTLRFGTNISPSDIIVRLMEANHSFLTLKIAGTTDEISVRDVEKIEFADGTVWTEAQLYQVYADQNSSSGDDYIHTYDGDDVINTGAGDDRIYSEDGDDIITGGMGDDYADGNWGNDTYIFNRGDGRDVFDGAFETDILRFGANISPSDIIVRLMEADHTFLTLQIARTTDEVSVRDVEKIEFADGTIWTQSQLYQTYADQNSTSGDDYIHTSYLNDVINSGAGDDRIYGEAGDDIISGGTGDDYADGGSGDNIYIFNKGDGRDVFQGGIYNDTIRFGEGILPSDIVVRLNEADQTFFTLRISGSNDEISIRSVEKISFANGVFWTEAQVHQIYADQNSTTGDDYLYFSSGTAIVNTGAGDDRVIMYQGNDVIAGGIGDDYVDGNAGNDVYIFNRGDGKDVFYGSSGSDTLRFGPTIGLGDLRVFSGPSEWTTIFLPDTGDIVEISSVEFVEFADGTRISVSDLPKSLQQSSTSAGAVVGTSANDILVGTGENDRLHGLGGDDRLSGGRGATRTYSG
ncbi:calcium-binding protein [Rhizobium sp. AN95]|uniref:calcium-binding protein n=1 Tax=Rhizobium sp. AN95 TaxID=3035216 RepID=UPI002B258CAE|nr:calcium-binding protein [Rhizobium sp. AN95]